MLILFDVDLDIEAKLTRMLRGLHSDPNAIEEHEAALEEGQRPETEEHVVDWQ
jgi:hypothetical protein